MAFKTPISVLRYIYKITSQMYFVTSKSTFEIVEKLLPFKSLFFACKMQAFEDSFVWLLLATAPIAWADVTSSKACVSQAKKDS